MSKGHFDDDNPGCSWGFEGRTGSPFSPPPSGSLLIVFDQDFDPVKMWEVDTVEHFDEPVYRDGWTWFAASEMSHLVLTSAESAITGFDFHEQAFLVLPAAGGWRGAPIELNDNQIAELFSQLGWSTDLRHR